LLGEKHHCSVPTSTKWVNDKKKYAFIILIYQFSEYDGSCTTDHCVKMSTEVKGHFKSFELCKEKTMPTFIEKPKFAAWPLTETPTLQAKSRVSIRSFRTQPQPSNGSPHLGFDCLVRQESRFT
jgi:hypothetical protein